MIAAAAIPNKISVTVALKVFTLSGGSAILGHHRRGVTDAGGDGATRLSRGPAIRSRMLDVLIGTLRRDVGLAELIGAVSLGYRNSRNRASVERDVSA